MSSRGTIGLGPRLFRTRLSTIFVRYHLLLTRICPQVTLGTTIGELSGQIDLTLIDRDLRLLRDRTIDREVTQKQYTTGYQRCTMNAQFFTRVISSYTGMNTLQTKGFRGTQLYQLVGFYGICKMCNSFTKFSLGHGTLPYRVVRPFTLGLRHQVREQRLISFTLGTVGYQGRLDLNCSPTQLDRLFTHYILDINKVSRLRLHTV